MKHLLTILCVLTSFTALAQFPNTHTQSSNRTKEVFYGAVNPRGGLINGRYADTAAANLDYVAGERGAQIVVGNTIYLRDNTATKWIVAGGYGVIASNITILNDSSISICNGSVCDTFSFTNIVVNNFSVVNDSTILVCDGNNVCDTLFIPPTPISKNFVDSTKIRGGDSLFYYINGNEYLGGIISPKSNISIANDSSLVICSSNKCDTFIFNNIIINSFTVVNDSTILVCDGNNTCDTLHITPTPLAKSYVDSVKVDGSLIYYYVNGNAILAGMVGGKDGRISGGIVTWSGQGLKFYISPVQYILDDKFYSSPLDSVTLDPASAQSRVDLFIVDTTSRAGKITGIADGNLLTPQVDPASQIALTTGIQINPGDTIPSNVVSNIVYSEHTIPPEWTTGTQGAAMTIDWENTTHPYAGTKDIYVSKYSNNSTPYFIAPSPYSVTNDATLSFWIYLNGKFTNQMYVELFDASTSASSWLRLTPYFNVNDSGKYQLVTVPVSRFIWANYSGNFDRMLFNLTGYDTSGTKGFYLDNIQFQKGINSIPSQTDYSNKVDSVLLKNDSLFQYIKGVKTFKGLASGSGVGGGITKLGDSPYGLIKLNDSTYLVDSTLLLTKLMAAATYLKITDTTDKWIPVGSKFPIGVIKPIIALNDSTLRFDSLNLTELRYSFTDRDTTTWTDSTIIDKKYLNDRIAAFVTSVAPWKTIGTAVYYKAGNVLIGDSTDDGHTFRLVGTMSLNLGSDAPGDIYYRDSLGTTQRLAAPTGFIKPVLGFKNGYPAYQEDSVGSGGTTLADTSALFVFGGGGANAGDTSSFTTSTIYGAFFNSLSDTLVLTRMQIGLQGTSPNVTVRVYWNDSLNVTAGATALTTSGSVATNIYGGTSVTSFANNKIPPNVWVWCKTSAVTTKPTFLSVTLIGYKKR